MNAVMHPCPDLKLKMADSALEETDEPTYIAPLHAVMPSLHLPVGTVNSTFWEGQTLIDQRASCSVDNSSAGSSQWIATVLAEAFADDTSNYSSTYSSLADLRIPVIVSVSPMCLSLPAFLSATPYASDPALSYRLVLHGRNLTAAGVRFAARCAHGYLPSTISVLPSAADVVLGIVLLISIPAGSPAGLIHVECRDATAAVTSCLPVLLAASVVTSVLNIDLAAEVVGAAEVLDYRCLDRIHDLIRDLGLWFEYAHICSTDATGYSAMRRAQLCSPAYQQVMRDIMVDLLQECRQRGWFHLEASMLDGLAVLGQPPGTILEQGVLSPASFIQIQDSVPSEAGPPASSIPVTPALHPVS